MAKAPNILILMLCAGYFVASPASAETLQIAAPAFSVHCPCSDNPPINQNIGEVARGVMHNSKGSYYAAVQIPNGQRVCKFSLVFRDGDSSFDITAQLVQKQIVIGGDPYAGPRIMAHVSSSGAQNVVRVASTRSISNPTISLADSFYFVVLTLPANTLEPLGIQIEYKPSCP